MKTTKYKIILSCLLIIFITSCSKDYLNVTPRLSQSNELTLSTYEGLESATAGAYGGLCSTNWYGAGFEITADLKGGLAKRGPVSSGRYINEYLWNNTASSTSNLWTTAYQTIARANNVINTIDDGFTEEGVTQEQLNVLKGECLFLRALSHWDMVRLYSQPYSAGQSNLGVPVVLKTENNYPSRNTVGEVYTQVVKDLTDAINLLPDNNPRGDDGAWADKMAATALLAKVYLYMEEWQNAAEMADAVIASDKYQLFDTADYKTWDQGGYWGSGGQGKEIIFQVDGSEGNSAHGYWEAISYMVNPSGYGDIAASHDLLGLYEAGDVRGDLFLEPAEHPGEFWTLKYPGRLGSLREYNVPVLRLSEMYLIRAEALLNGASVSGATALDDYNELREHRNLSDVTTVTLQDIYNERRRELCFEGNELFDLARTQRSLVRNDYSGLDHKDIPFVQGGTAGENYLWAMPIPQQEIDANENMVQNPGY